MSTNQINIAPIDTFEESEVFALKMDAQDPLSSYRKEFSFPQQENGDDEIYLCGNSLGLMPNRSKQLVEEELQKWGKWGVKGHFESEHPWMPYHEFLSAPMAKLVGANDKEVVCMNSLTANLHFMMVSFYRPTTERYKILIEDHAFPSDTYAVVSQLEFHGYSEEEALIKLTPRPGEELIRKQDMEKVIKEQGDEIALILLPGVQYYTGQVFPMAAITEWGHDMGCVVGFDLAHATGNIELNLHHWDVDFACWCHYKYLNSGPGAVAGCFVHERHHQSSLKRFAGWWGHDKNTRFEMGPKFQPMASAEAWQLSNPPILSLASILGSLQIFTEAGGMKVLTQKSRNLTNYLQYLLQQKLPDKISIITPDNEQERGSQLSLVVDIKNLSGKEVFEKIEQAGVTADWRNPNVIRIAPTPLYNSFLDVYRFVEILAASLEPSL